MEDNKTKPEREGPRQYASPAIVWEEIFDPYVFHACGKMVVETRACRANMKS